MRDLFRGFFHYGLECNIEPELQGLTLRGASQSGAAASPGAS